MTTELTLLLITAVFAGSMWIPYIVGVNTTEYEGQDNQFVRPPAQSDMEPWVHRSYRAHMNLLEQFLPYAVVVLIGHAAGVSTAITVGCAWAFLGLRVLHAIGYITAVARYPLRPLIFTGGWLVILVYAGAILLA